VEKSIPIHELSALLRGSKNRHFNDDFVITDLGSYIGAGTWQDLLHKITHALVETARYANPLTLLSGYVPINERIDDLIKSGKTFAACHCDIDNLMPFNKVCGYPKGDELIKFTARLLGNICDPAQDFIGHLGGDNFILALQSPDWEQRCDRALSAFAQSSATLFDRDHRSIGGYLSSDRQGRIIHHPLPTLSIGGVWVIPELFGSHHEVHEAAMAAKQKAQEKTGNSMFIERRQLHPHVVTEVHHNGAKAHYG
jgi:GGDEF domain-containing protein